MLHWFHLSVLIVLAASLWTDATEASPLVPKTNNSTVISDANPTVVGAGAAVKSRQMLNNDVPTASTGLSSGNPNVGNSLQSMALMQQLQVTTGGNPMAMAAELAAQDKENLQLQTQNQQQSILAAVQLQQQHIAAAQAALSQQNMVNGTPSPMNAAGLTNNVQTLRIQQQLEAQKQKLLAQQALLQEQAKPESQQPSQQQILLAQLIRNPGANQGQLLEQFRQQQVKQQAEVLSQLQLYQQQQQQPSSFQSPLMGQSQPSVLQHIGLGGILAGYGPSRLGLSSPTGMLGQEQQQIMMIQQQIMLRQQLAAMMLSRYFN